MNAPPFRALSPLQASVAALAIRAVAVLERAGLASHCTISIRIQGRQVAVKLEGAPIGNITLDRGACPPENDERV